MYDRVLFLYSQDLSNCTTEKRVGEIRARFLYSQDLSNCTTKFLEGFKAIMFLYSQDLSNCTTTCGTQSVSPSFCTLKI